MKTVLILAGYIFLINPEIMMLDILPDFIGYILFALGLKKLSRIDEDFSDAKKYAGILTFIGIVKFVFSFSVFTTQIQTNKLTFQFIFCSAELIAGILFSKSIVHGADMLSARPFGNAVIPDFSEFRIFMFLFFPIKEILSVIPQSAVLFYPDIDADPSKAVDFASTRTNYMYVRNILTVICGIFILVFGIYAMGVFKKFLKKAQNDSVFSQGLRKLYEDKFINSRKAMEKSSVFSGLNFAFAGLFFTIGIYFDGFFAIPGAITVLFSYFSVKRFTVVLGEKKGKLLSFLFAGTFVSFAVYVVQTVFFFVYGETYRENYVLTFPGLALSLLNSSIMIVSLWIQFYHLKKIYIRFSGEESFYLFPVLPIVSSLVILVSTAVFLFITENMYAIAGMWAAYLISVASLKQTADKIKEIITRKTDLEI